MENREEKQEVEEELSLDIFEDVFKKWFGSFGKISGLDIFNVNYIVNYVTCISIILALA